MQIVIETANETNTDRIAFYGAKDFQVSNSGRVEIYFPHNIGLIPNTDPVRELPGEVSTANVITIEGDVRAAINEHMRNREDVKESITTESVDTDVVVVSSSRYPSLRDGALAVQNEDLTDCEFTLVKPSSVSSDTHFCENCGPVTNVNHAGKTTCLNCGDTIHQHGQR